MSATSGLPAMVGGVRTPSYFDLPVGGKGLAECTSQGMGTDRCMSNQAVERSLVAWSQASSCVSSSGRYDRRYLRPRCSRATRHVSTGASTTDRTARSGATCPVNRTSDATEVPLPGGDIHIPPHFERSLALVPGDEIAHPAAPTNPCVLHGITGTGWNTGAVTLSSTSVHL